MNRKVLKQLDDWIIDCYIGKNPEKARKLDKIYSKMFLRQIKYYKPSWEELLNDK